MELERRDFAFADVPEADLMIESRSDGRTAIKGYAVVYNRLSLDLGGFRERIMPGAFDKMLERIEGRHDLVSYFNHNPDFILGRESSGTLEVWADDKGVGYTVVPPASRTDVIELISRKDVKGSSFSFVVEKGGETFTSDETGRTIREVRSATMYELGPVVQPAYPATSAAVAKRSYEAWLASQVVPETAQADMSRSALRGVAAAWAAILRLKSA